VDVRVLTNGPHIDKEVVRQAGRRCYEQLLACGARIFEYRRTMLHAKVLLVDSHWVTVGSVNFDNRSFALKLVNPRREFFYATPGEVRALLAQHAGHLLDVIEEPEAAGGVAPERR
jgi:phosphatidylserine/phosphatidylglycerophosphate/cardiolipin synthase-like enzyme